MARMCLLPSNGAVRRRGPVALSFFATIRTHRAWQHWAIYDIPPSQMALAAGASRHPKAFNQAINDFQRPGYGGPCPPHRHGPHRYYFRLLALSVDRLALGSSASCRDVEREARKHLLAEATLVGVYQQ
jgi:Raf kinase inhibitor-like YbhB/YbcL family protein